MLSLTSAKKLARELRKLRSIISTGSYDKTAKSETGC